MGQLPASAVSIALTSQGSPVTTVASGSKVTLTATVVAGGAPLTSGQISFCDATAKDCTDIHLLGTASLTRQGTASFTFISGPGSHSYKAVLLQSGFGESSSSAALTLTVSAPSPSVASTATSLAVSGNLGNYTLSATVTGTGSTTPLTGSVSFLDTSYSDAPWRLQRSARARRGWALKTRSTFPSRTTAPHLPHLPISTETVILTSCS